jgi:hypothetical protein
VRNEARPERRAFGVVGDAGTHGVGLGSDLHVHLRIRAQI